MERVTIKSEHLLKKIETKKHEAIHKFMDEFKIDKNTALAFYAGWYLFEVLSDEEVEITHNSFLGQY